MLQTLAALAEPTRLRIVELIGLEPRAVADICDSLSMGQPQVSKHLRVLRDAGVVGVEARGQQRIYSLRAAPFRELDEWLERYRSLWDEKLNRLDELVAELKAREDTRHAGSKKKR